MRDAVETHAWTEDDLLFPVLVAHEHPGVLATTVSREDLKRLVDSWRPSTFASGRSSARSDELTSGFKTPAGAPLELDDLVHLVKELTASLIEELDLEDRCLLPRAREIAAGRALEIRHGATEIYGHGDAEDAEDRPGSPRHETQRHLWSRTLFCSAPYKDRIACHTSSSTGTPRRRFSSRTLRTDSPG